MEILDQHLPNRTDISLIEFSDKIIDSILRSNPLDYLNAVKLMTDMKVDDIIKQPVEKTLQQLMDGFIENDIVSLMTFYRGLRGK